MTTIKTFLFGAAVGNDVNVVSCFVDKDGVVGFVWGRVGHAGGFSSSMSMT